MFRLCLAIGGDKCVHPDVLETVLNRRQVCEWMAFEKLFPFGDQRADYRSALQTFWIRAALIDSNETEEQPQDFMPQFDNDSPKTEAQKIRDEILESM